MTLNESSRPPPEDLVFRLRAKMDDNSYQILGDGDRKILAYRVGGEDIDLLRSMEFLSEFLQSDSLEDVSDIVMISDRNFQTSPIDMIIPKLEVKKEDDDKLFQELRDSMKKTLEPLTFTMENDILELYRIAIRVEGSHNRTDESIGLELLKVDLPKEGDVIYLIFNDGYRKMSRSHFESLVEDSLSSMRQGPALMKDPPKASFSKSGSIAEGPKKEIKKPTISDRIKRSAQDKETSKTSMLEDPRLVAREISKEMASLGYRKDTMFSRNDVNQFFFISMKGPAVFLKIIEKSEEIDSFLRVLSHRRDALGLLISKKWDPKLEAISRINGFIYLEIERSQRATMIIKEVLREGGNS